MLGRMIDRSFAVVGAFLFCQFPLFIQQYMLLLQGHLTESRLQLQELEHNASLGNKTLLEYIHKFVVSSDPDFVRQGQWMESIQARAAFLGEAYTTLRESSVWTKPFVFLFHFDRPIFTETARLFSFGFPLTLEGCIYAIIGIGFGVLCYRFLRRGWIAFVNLFKRSK